MEKYNFLVYFFFYFNFIVPMTFFFIYLFFSFTSMLKIKLVSSTIFTRKNLQLVTSFGKAGNQHDTNRSWKSCTTRASGNSSSSHSFINFWTRIVESRDWPISRNRVWIFFLYFCFLRVFSWTCRRVFIARYRFSFCRGVSEKIL